MAGPGLLAHVLVSKFGDHLPLYRLHEIFTCMHKASCMSHCDGSLNPRQRDSLDDVANIFRLKERDIPLKGAR